MAREVMLSTSTAAHLKHDIAQTKPHKHDIALTKPHTEVQAYTEALEERLADTLREPQDEKQGAGSIKEEKYDSLVDLGALQDFQGVQWDEAVSFILTLDVDFSSVADSEAFKGEAINNFATAARIHAMHVKVTPLCVDSLTVDDDDDAFIIHQVEMLIAQAAGDHRTGK